MSGMNQPPACLSDTWTPVADRVPAGPVDRWAYRITAWERLMLTAALRAKTALTAQKRTSEGLVLMARRVGQ